MKYQYLLISLLFFYCLNSYGQNVGIGTSNPQQKLHVAGNARIDAMAGSDGILKFNSAGDLVPLTNSGNSNDALLGNGAWGSVAGTVPAGTVVATETYNDANLISKGFKLYGSIPGFTKYVSSSYTASANSWAVTYFKGDVTRYTPPYFDSNDLMVWADTVMYLFSDNALYAYNPVTDNWRFVFYNGSTSFRASAYSKAIWTGSEILVYGGYYTNSNNNGFRYNPSSNSWTAIPSLNQPEARSDYAMELINNKLIVWGGLSATSVFLNTGAMLDLSTNTWTTMSTTGAPSPRYFFTGVNNTTQNTLMIWGGVATSSSFNDGAIFNPASNNWTAINNTGAPVARNAHCAVWTGSEMVVHGGYNTSGNIINSGGKYNPLTNSWSATNTTGAPAIIYASSIWTGSKMLVSGGAYSTVPGSPYSSFANLYDPVSNNWSGGGAMKISKLGHKSLMANNMILVFGGSTVILNTITNTYSNYGGYPQGSRYFLTGTPITETQVLNATELFLYIKQ